MIGPPPGECGVQGRLRRQDQRIEVVGGEDRKGGVQAPDGVVGPPVRLADFDLIIGNDSGGKDELCALTRVAAQGRAGGVLDRLVVQYNRLGNRVSWPGAHEMGPNADLLVARYGDRPRTKGLPRARAAALGLRCEVTRREHQDADLLDQVDRYGKFPSLNRRSVPPTGSAAPAAS